MKTVTYTDPKNTALNGRYHVTNAVGPDWLRIEHIDTKKCLLVERRKIMQNTSQTR